MLLSVWVNAVLPLKAAPIRNVILCVGDGMGTAQIAAARCYAGRPLVFETFPYQSLITTFLAGGGVTDSAAASTAMSTGFKVGDGVVSLALPGDARELETLLEHFARLGKSTGLVTTSYLSDATPAGFGAHETNRYSHVRIVEDYLRQTRPNVLLGGGGGGLSAEVAAEAGYRAATDAASLSALRGGRLDHVAGVFGFGAMPYVLDGLGPYPSLAQMTDAALGFLDDDPDGFFLMVEGGRIDHACHGNALEHCVAETLAFEEAIQRVAAWAENRSDTLLLVTADHETGGLEVLADNGPGVYPDVSWATGWHTSAPVALFATGVNASLVTQVTDNTELRLVACSEAQMPATGFSVERLSATQNRVHWAVNSGDVCRIECKLSLREPVWQACGVVTAASTRVSFIHTNKPGFARGYYRVETLAP